MLDFRKHQSKVTQDGVYDYLIYNYVNGLKDKILNSSLPDTINKAYSSEDLK